MIAADPDAARPQWVVPARFWDDLEKMLAANPTVAPGDAAMADQARTLIALAQSDPAWKALLDKAALAGRRDRCTPARSTSRSASTPATAGSARRTAGCGAPTGSAGRRRR